MLPPVLGLGATTTTGEPPLSPPPQAVIKPLDASATSATLALPRSTILYPFELFLISSPFLFLLKISFATRGPNKQKTQTRMNKYCLFNRSSGHSHQLDTDHVYKARFSKRCTNECAGFGVSSESIRHHGATRRRDMISSPSHISNE